MWFSVILVPPDRNLTAEQHGLLRDLLAKSKEKLRRLTTDHRDLHGSVSKVGKTIDRQFVSDLSSTTKTDVLLEERNIHLLNKVIAQHFYRQGMDDVADTLVEVRSFSFQKIFISITCFIRKQNCQKKTSAVSPLLSFTVYGKIFKIKIFNLHWNGRPDILKS